MTPPDQHQMRINKANLCVPLDICCFVAGREGQASTTGSVKCHGDRNAQHFPTMFAIGFHKNFDDVGSTYKKKELWSFTANRSFFLDPLLSKS